MNVKERIEKAYLRGLADGTFSKNTVRKERIADLLCGTCRGADILCPECQREYYLEQEILELKEKISRYE